MKVLIVSQYFWPENFRINDLVRGLCQRGHSVTVLTGLPNYPEGRFFRGYGFFGKKREDYHGAQVVRVPMLPRGKGSGARLLLNYLSFAFFASLLAPFRCREEYDVIFVYEPSPITVGLPALLLRKLKKAPVAFWVQDLWPESLSATGAVRARWLLNLVERLVKFIYRGCDLVMVQSEAFVPSLEKLGVNRERIAYFPNSAEDLYAPVALPQDAPERAGLPDGFRVMFAGNIGAAQDFPTIVASAELLRERKDIQWIILGDGRMKPWVAEQIRLRGLEPTFHLLGQRPAETMPRYFAHADLLLATLRREPIFAYTIPSKLQSYMACGRPVVAALEGEGGRIVEESGAGWAVPPEDPRALADAVLAASALAQSERDAMGNRGEDFFREHFEREQLLSQLDAELAEVTQARQ
jgi:glycosyltransferase involved in cell wall biosynthesis